MLFGGFPIFKSAILCFMWVPKDVVTFKNTMYAQPTYQPPGWLWYVYPLQTCFQSATCVRICPIASNDLNTSVDHYITACTFRVGLELCHAVKSVMPGQNRPLLTALQTGNNLV
jgi:hypothetical protein